jgi:hypothetical protein
MKLYEALTFLSRKDNSWFCYHNEDTSVWYSVFKFSEDKKEVYETSLHYALTDCYWRKTTGNGWGQGVYNVRWCENEYECANDITALWKIYFKSRAEVLDDCEYFIKQCTSRLKCALRKKVIDRAMYEQLEVLMCKTWEEVNES